VLRNGRCDEGIVGEPPADRDQVGSRLSHRRKRFADDQVVAGLRGQFLEQELIGARLADNQRLRRVGDHAGAIGDGDRADAGDPCRRRSKHRVPLLAGRRRTADPPAVLRDLPERRIALGEHLPQVFRQDDRQVHGAGLRGGQGLRAPPDEIDDAQRGERCQHGNREQGGDRFGHCRCAALDAGRASV
jgi:hypothetical protein